MRNENLNLNGIATVVANETNGSISRDLYEALKAMEFNYNYSDEKKLSEDIKVEDRVLNYGQDDENIDKEADIVLQLRAKNGDHAAIEMLLIANKNLLSMQASLYVYNKSGDCNRTFDECLSIVNLTYLEFINSCPIYSNGKAYKSASNDTFGKRIGTTERIDRSEIAPVHGTPKLLYALQCN